MERIPEHIRSMRHVDLHILLSILELDEYEHIPRFRTAYIEDDEIVIHTRTGGGNRDFHENETTCRENYPEYFDGKTDPTGPWNDDLRAHPRYLYDTDSEYDATYADFYFNIPEPYKDDVLAYTRSDQDHEYSKHWTELLLKLSA